MLFETIVDFQRTRGSLVIGPEEENLDGLNFWREKT